jgi:hypothetical protein
MNQLIENTEKVETLYLVVYQEIKKLYSFTVELGMMFYR